MRQYFAKHSGSEWLQRLRAAFLLTVWFPDYLHSIAKPVNPCGKCIKELLQETSLWINDIEINMDSTKLCSSIFYRLPFVLKNLH